MKPLSPDFFEQETLVVAKALLGQHLMVWDKQAEDYMVCKIVETEAYTAEDPSCHAYKGAKGRAATLFKAPGLAYVYFIYGMYHCLNVVTEATGKAGAVLFRGVEPIFHPSGAVLNTRGPGRLCKALNITKAEHNEMALTEENECLYLAEGSSVNPSEIVTTTRIGISVAQDYPWRFYLQDNPWVSVKSK
jgi:DNA-3-methyladenine glycosylase